MKDWISKSIQKKAQDQLSEYIRERKENEELEEVRQMLESIAVAFKKKGIKGFNSVNFEFKVV